MDSVKESNHSWPYKYDHHVLEDEILKRRLLTAAKTMSSDVITMQSVRVSSIIDLKELKGLDRDEGLARRCIVKVKYALLREQEL